MDGNVCIYSFIDKYGPYCRGCIYSFVLLEQITVRVNMFIYMKPTAVGFNCVFLFCNVNDNNCKDFLVTNLVGRNFGFDQNQDKETRKKSTVHN